MGRLADQLEADRAVRQTAREAFESRLAQVRQDLDERGIGGRIADKIGQEAQDALNEAIDVAEQSKGIIAGTIAALALWFFREPVMAWLEGLIARSPEGNDEGDADRE